jgi:hypothetical protein
MHLLALQNNSPHLNHKQQTEVAVAVAENIFANHH